MQKKTQPVTDFNKANDSTADAPTPEELHRPSATDKIVFIAIGVLAVLCLGGATLFALGAIENGPQVHTDRAEPQTPTPQLRAELRASTWSSDFPVMLEYAHLYDEIHPFIYFIKGRSSNPPEPGSLWSNQQKRERIAALRAKNPRLRILPTIFRWENAVEKINEVIGMNGRTDIRDRHIEAILHEVETYGYDGIDIDYEGMTCNKKEKFEEFIELLAKKLHARGKLLSVAVHPKTPIEPEEEDEAKPPRYKLKKCAGLKKPIVLDFHENWRGPLTHDYAFLAQHADMVKVMAYELHPRKYRNPGPGPQAPNAWLEQIIRYASDKVPPEKLYMAIPTYGYDWGLDCRAPIRSVYYSDVQRILAGPHKKIQPTDIDKILSTEKGAKGWFNLTRFRDIHEDKVYEDPSLWYRSGGCMRVAFYMDKTAFAEKMQLLKQHRLAGFSFWQLTHDNDPEIHRYLASVLAR